MKPWRETMVALAALAGLVAIFWQLTLMRDANELTQESLRLTRESNQSSDATTKRTQELMAESNRITREVLEESRRQAEVSRIQSTRDAAASLAVAKDAIRRSERPWINIEQIDVILTAGRPLSLKILLRNVGKTPALDPRPSCTVSLKGEVAGGLLSQGAKIPVVTPIGPDQVTEYVFAFPDVVADDSLLAKIKQATVRMRMLVVVTFADAFKEYRIAYACHGERSLFVPFGKRF